MLIYILTLQLFLTSRVVVSYGNITKAIFALLSHGPHINTFYDRFCGVYRSQSRNISASFDLDQNHHHNLYATTAKAEVPDHINIHNASYCHKKKPDYHVAFNNQFRFDKNPRGRFTSIFFHYDPWTNMNNSSVIFVTSGVPNGIHPLDKKSEFSCHFSYPIKSKSIARFFQFIIYCPIPTEMNAILLKDSAPSFRQNQKIILSLFERDNLLLKNVIVYREKLSDRQHVKTAMSTVVDNLESPMVIDWILYHIMIGIEHFYIFDNSRKHHNDIKYSQLVPFIKANLLTVIYHPYIVCDNNQESRWNLDVQEVTLNTALLRYGPYIDYLGTNDVDEFLFFTKDLVDEYVSHSEPQSLVNKFYDLHPCNDNVKCVGYTLDTLDMGNSEWQQGKCYSYSLSSYCDCTLLEFVLLFFFVSFMRTYSQVIIKNRVLVQYIGI